MKWEVFNSHTGDTICRVPFMWMAKLLCRVDGAWDYDDMDREIDKLVKQIEREEGNNGKSEPS